MSDFGEIESSVLLPCLPHFAEMYCRVSTITTQVQNRAADHNRASKNPLNSPNFPDFHVPKPQDGPPLCRKKPLDLPRQRRQVRLPGSRSLGQRKIRKASSHLVD